MPSWQLAVGINWNSGGWLGSYHPQETAHVRDDQWYGPLYDFVMETSAMGGWYVNITAPDPLMVNMTRFAGVGGKSFGHCSYATALGDLDLCIGMTTVTDRRLEIGRWYIVQLNALSLVVPEVKTENSFEQSLLVVFQPFTPAVFLVLGLVLLLAGCLVTLFERLHDHPPEDWDASARTEFLTVTRRLQRQSSRESPQGGKLPPSTPVSSPAEEHRYPTMAEHLGLNVISCVRCVYSLGTGYSTCLPARLTQMGLGMFMMLLVASYTANLTTFLVSQAAKRGAVESWSEVIDRGLSVCGTRMSAASAREAYPMANWAHDPEDGLLGINFQRNVLRFVDEGVCDVAVMDFQDVITAQRSVNASERHCNKMRVGDPIAYEPVGMPMTTVGSTANLLSREFAAATAAGVWQRMRDNYNVAPKCGTGDQGAGTRQTPRMDLDQLVGTLSPLALLATLGLAITLGSLVRGDSSTSCGLPSVARRNKPGPRGRKTMPGKSSDAAEQEGGADQSTSPASGAWCGDNVLPYEA